MSIRTLKAYREALVDEAYLVFDDDDELAKIEIKILIVDGKIEEKKMFEFAA